MLLETAIWCTARGEPVIKMPCCWLLRQSIFIYFISYNLFFFPGQNKKEEKKTLASLVVDSRLTSDWRLTRVRGWPLNRGRTVMLCKLAKNAYNLLNHGRH